MRLGATSLAELVIGKDAIMFRPPHLESLEDRTVPSGLWAALLGPRAITPEGGSTVFALEMGEIHINNRYAFVAQVDAQFESVILHDSLDMEKIEAAIAASPDWQLGELMEVRRQFAYDTFSSLASNLVTDLQGNSVESTFPDFPTAAPHETLSTATTDRSEGDSEPSGQSLLLSTGASLASLWPLADNVFGDVTTDVIVPQWVADAMILETGPSGLPAPQADLVPAGGKHLTTVATYLVGSPPARPPVAMPAVSRPDSRTTDFIVGFEPQTADPIPQNSTDSQKSTSSSPPIRESSQAIPARVEVKTGGISEDKNNSLPETQKVAGDTSPAPPETEDLPEETGGSD
jgi:hypothetical protein